MRIVGMQMESRRLVERVIVQTNLAQNPFHFALSQLQIDPSNHSSIDRDRSYLTYNSFVFNSDQPLLHYSIVIYRSR